MPANKQPSESLETEISRQEDLEWALERVNRLCASALVDAQVYRTKLLKGFGYPNEVFRSAQDFRALLIVLNDRRAARAELQRLSQENKKLTGG